MTSLWAASTATGWKLGIGDPTVLGWVTVVAYFWAAWECTLACRREVPRAGTPATRPSRFWLGLAVLLFCLGLNKQLDLQTLLTDLGREALRSRGLYAVRRDFQIVFIKAVAFAMTLSALALVWISRKSLRERGLAAVGICLLFGFVVIRAASFHHVDLFLAARLGGVRWNSIFELSGIALTGFGAWRVAHRSARRAEQSA